MQPDIIRLWDGVYIGSQVPAELRSVCWVLRNSAGVVPILERYARCAHLFAGDVSLPTLDFERLYTGLPQGDIVDRLAGLLGAVWQLHHQQEYLLVTADGFEWLDVAHLPREARGGQAYHFRRRRRDFYLFTLGRAQELVHLLVTRSYFSVGDRVFRQAEGIPMGLNPCVYFANFYLFTYELEFVRSVVHVLDHSPPGCEAWEEAIRVLRAFAHVFRYVDDLGAITHDLECFRACLSRAFRRHGIAGIYPEFLVLTDTSVDGGRSAHYMDVDIHRPTRGMPLATDIYDRRSEPEFIARVMPVRMPSPDSMLDPSVGRNILVAQMIRFQRLCSYAGYFARRTAAYLRDMVSMGYQEDSLWRTVQRHIHHLSWHYGLSPDRLMVLVREFFCELPRVGGCG